ncbi:hypothetical protein BKI52_09115 [marine bacterium AO1-C]|nr:hypothetical protein BKI52_09115 [marine bacterium AO1-C]
MRNFEFKTLAELLEGNWQGEGTGFFPTIQTFEYTELLKFECDSERAIMHYEQKTWIKPTLANTARNAHWESGFISFEQEENPWMMNVHSNGRVESLALKNITCDHEVFELTFLSNYIKNDERMLSSDRKWMINTMTKTLTYEMSMSTLKVRDKQLHLTANLKKGS